MKNHLKAFPPVGRHILEPRVAEVVARARPLDNEAGARRSGRLVRGRGVAMHLKSVLHCSIPRIVCSAGL
eukprot:1024694-Pyramimonas_sp.AAC.1